MTQKQMILKHLKRGRTITQLEAFNRFGVCRLSERCRELRADGYDIRGYMAPLRSRHGRTVGKRYYLAGK